MVSITDDWRPVSELPKPTPDGLTILLINDKYPEPLQYATVARWYEEEGLWDTPGTYSAQNPSSFTRFLLLPDT